ncbi:hypothetical protein GCM10010331_16900 [Streptomyces xanthochromogenes]|uniref:DUF6777 domain-containing protein n=1 Tax=Streptomyces xanthochromogenes TaxID=67384 RepID=UPI001673BDB3|nr:DUF6777 domain-containing protein [Streptomyces xanthochromogenes]GHB31088.1 hypothetical protein GCM10010331_16900 [Streptomyces xanthochromogenes]
MSVEPPSSGRPTGPPSGPLSGPSQPSPSGPGDTEAGATRAGTPPPEAERPSGPPSSGPPSGPVGGGGHGDGPGEPGPGSGASPGPGRPWWKSAPRVAAISAVVVAAVVLAVVLTRPGGSSQAGGEVFLQPAGKSGPDPFTASTARVASSPPSPSALPSSSASANVTRGVNGAAPGLYGGTRKVGSCDVEKQAGALLKDPAKNKAFASVLGIEPSGVPAYLRALTPVQLRFDTRVTNHGYRDGAPTSYQAVLQAGTAVLVDDRGVPRVRCACGNPLLPPVAQKSTPKRTGEAWPGYRPSNVVVVAPATQTVKKFVVYDPDSGAWFERRKGDTGTGDTKTNPPPVIAPSLHPSDSPSANESSSTGSQPPCDSRSADTSSVSSCPPESVPPSAPSSSTVTQPPASTATQTPPPSSDATRTPSSTATRSSSSSATRSSSSSATRPPASASEESPASSEPAQPPSSPGPGGAS